MNSVDSVDEANGVAGSGGARLADVVAAVWGRAPAEIARWTCEPAVARIDNMTTKSIDRYRGTFTDGASWSVIAKSLQPASAAPQFAFIPVEHHADTLAALHWLDEPACYRCGLAEALPAGLRMPALHAIDEVPERITLWLEDVPDATEWTLDRYHRTAHALGRLGGSWDATEAADRFGLGQRDIGGMYFGKVCHFDLQILGDDAFWRRPAIAAVADDGLRRDLFGLAGRMPALIRSLGDLPRGVCHGDATNGNFLEPGDGDVVAIDWSYGNVDALGSDLAQLLAGRFESGDARVDDLEPITATVFDGYREGLAAAGREVDQADLRRAWATHLAIRSVFSALIDELPTLSEAERIDRLRVRAALARHGIALAG